MARWKKALSWDTVSFDTEFPNSKKVFHRLESKDLKTD